MERDAKNKVRSRATKIKSDNAVFVPVERNREIKKKKGDKEKGRKKGTEFAIKKNREQRRFRREVLARMLRGSVRD